MARILVAYATKYGSTRAVAQRIGDRLRASGLQADVRAAREVRSLEGIDAVVLGSALYYFKMTAEGRRFLARHAAALAKSPFAVFGMGPIEDTQEHWRGANEHLDKSIALVAGVTPKAKAVFGGAFGQEALRFPETLTMRNFPKVDLRDWDAVDSWADRLPEALGLERSS